MATVTDTQTRQSRKGMRTRNGKEPQCNICECGEHAWAPMTRGRVTLVSNLDSVHLKSWHWSSNPRGYAYRVDTGLGGQSLHRIICKTPDGMFTDHKNGNPSDNRRENLRACTPQQNSFNVRKKRKTRKNKGVRRVNNKWEARIGHNWKQLCLGRFDTEQEALAAYDAAAVRLFGDFAKPNIGA